MSDIISGMSVEICERERVKVGKWVKLAQQVSLVELDAILKKGGEYLKRKDRVKVNSGQKLIFTGGSNGGGEKHPNWTSFVFWNEEKEVVEYPGEAQIVAYYLKPGKVIVKWPLAGMERLVRERGTGKHFISNPALDNLESPEKFERHGSAKVIYNEIT